MNSIVDVAVRLFLQRGYDGTSMAMLADAAGLTKSSLYHHVEGKEELLRLGVGRALDAYSAMLAEDGAIEESPRNQLRYIMRRTCELVAAYVPEVALLVRVRGNTPTEVWAIERRRELNEVIARKIQAAAAPAPVSDPRLMARLILGLINSSVDWMDADSAPDAERLTSAVDTLLFGNWLR